MTRNARANRGGVKLIGYPDLVGLRPAPRLEIAREINVGDSNIQIHLRRQSFLSHFTHELCDGIEDSFGVRLEFCASGVGELFRRHKNDVNSVNVFLVRNSCRITRTGQSSDEQSLAKDPVR